ncbi:carboxymuconolactone decarboxylase family protein [Micropruina sonneratiae]|uniref:carboxymuconolactone decarboxylase family protein n=1 Tax=Micropruina sonneratiae TaxID=2986940 RepID=UPI002227B6FD|nr:carboxymuconolactone decarboxylase family protein [Micropruina sp. KQZ13P-5]MCW3158304.1 carboxymuconolactone decarboxylase family protein [Micropruina sp. KQZ13P-5]
MNDADIHQSSPILPGAGIDTLTRRRLARVPIEPPAGPFGALLTWLGRRLYGRELDNAHALAHNRRVLFATFGHERTVARFNRLDPTLKALAVMAAASEIGCSWCIDFGYHLADAEGIDLAKLAAVPDWRTADNLTELERRVIDFAVAATRTPPQVTDEQVTPLRSALGDDGLVELAMMVAIENQRSRFNAALGLVSQGFSATCSLPSRP